MNHLLKLFLEDSRSIFALIIYQYKSIFKKLQTGRSDTHIGFRVDTRSIVPVPHMFCHVLRQAYTVFVSDFSKMYEYVARTACSIYLL